MTDGEVARPVRRTDWKTLPLPERRTTIPLDRRFSAAEMEAIRYGVLPRQMEDKWFVFFEEDVLYFHRSWTGFLVYAVRFAPDGPGARMTGADVNRDPAQYREKDDRRDAGMVSFLIDSLLLRRPAELPSDEPSPEMRALKTWSAIGRAAAGEHPDGE